VAANLIHTLLLAMAANLAMLVVAQLFGGLGFLFLIVSSQTYVSHQADDHTRERGFGFLALTAAIGFVLGPPLGGALTVGFSYRAVFGLSGILAAIGLTVLLLDQDAAPDEGTQRQTAGVLTQLRALVSNPSLVSVLLVSFAVVFVVSLRNSFLPLLLKDKHLDEMTIGALYGVFAVAMTAVRLIIGRVMGTVARERLLAATLLLLAAGHGLLPVLASPAWLGAVMLLGGMGFGISQPLTMVMVSDHSGSGLAMGVRFTTITSATVFSPLVMGWLVDFGGLELPFYLGAAALLSLMLILSRGAFRS
jgi:MFS family permease